MTFTAVRVPGALAHNVCVFLKLRGPDPGPASQYSKSSWSTGIDGSTPARASAHASRKAFARIAILCQPEGHPRLCARRIGSLHAMLCWLPGLRPPAAAAVRKIRQVRQQRACVMCGAMRSGSARRRSGALCGLEVMSATAWVERRFGTPQHMYMRYIDTMSVLSCSFMPYRSLS